MPGCWTSYGATSCSTRPTKNTLIKLKPLQPHVAEAWVGHMRREFPTGKADISEIPEGLDLSTLTTDPDDQHVCALAIAGEADWLFTYDRGYLRSALASHGVHVTSPDVFLSEVIDNDPTPFIELVNAQLAVWGGGHRSLDDLLAAYERAKVPVFVGKLRDARAARRARRPGSTRSRSTASAITLAGERPSTAPTSGLRTSPRCRAPESCSARSTIGTRSPKRCRP